jgi:hypothetical protein
MRQITIKVWNYQITCSSPERCTGLTTPTIGLNRISIWRSGAGWRFIVQSLSNFGLLRDALVLNLELCGGEFFNQFCLSGRYPLESVGHTRRYRSPNR